METKWEEEKVNKLLSWARKTLRCDIPIMEEISDLSNFLHSLRLIHRTEADRVFLKVEKTYKLNFCRWFNKEKRVDIPIPEDALYGVYDPVQRIVINKCEYLAKMVKFIDTENNED